MAMLPCSVPCLVYLVWAMAIARGTIPYLTNLCAISRGTGWGYYLNVPMTTGGTGGRVSLPIVWQNRCDHWIPLYLAVLGLRYYACCLCIGGLVLISYFPVYGLATLNIDGSPLTV